MNHKTACCTMILLLVWTVIPWIPAHAGSYVVTNTNDSGAGSLRQAIIDLNAATAAGDLTNTITFETSGTITLDSLLGAITEEVTLVNASGITLVLPSVGAGSSLSGLRTASFSTINGTLPNLDVKGAANGVYGVYAPLSGFNSDISGSIRAEAGTSEAFGVWASMLDVGGVSGSVTAIAGTDQAAGLYASALNINGDISGSILAVAGGDNARGIYAGDLAMDGSISGSIIARAGRNEAFGIYTGTNLFITGGISGTVSAQAAGHTAIGLYSHSGSINGGDTGTALTISGTVAAEANGLAVGIAARGQMNLYITGSVSGVDTSGSGSGYAIRSGRADMAGGWAGDNNVDDTVVLGDGAGITGHIDLGGGTNVLSMAGSGTMTGNLSNITTFSKVSGGYWEINGNTDVVNMDIESGTLRLNSSSAAAPTNTVSGNLAVARDGVLQIGVYQTAAPSLTVSGTATVDGSLVFIPAALMAAGTSFTAMTAASLTGTGSYTAPLFSVDTSSGTSVVLTKKAYTDLSLTSINAITLAGVLSPLTATATGDMATLLTGLENASTVAEFQGHLEQLTPVTHLILAEESLELARIFSSVTQQRLAEVRSVYKALSGTGIDQDDPSTWPLLAANGETPGGGFILRDDPQTSFYCRLLGREGGESGYDDIFGFHVRSTGFSAGTDRLLWEGFAGGLNIIYTGTDLDYDDAGSSEAQIQSLSLGVHSSWFRGQWVLNTALAAGYNQYEVIRKMPFLDRRADSDFAGILLSSEVSGGYDLVLGGLTLTPQTSLAYARLMQEEVQETGAGAANLSVDARDTNALISSLGVRAATRIPIREAFLDPVASIFWDHELLSRDMSVDTTMAGNSGTVYSMVGRQSDRDRLRLSLGITAYRTKRSAVSLGYTGEFSENAWKNNGVLQWRLLF